MVPSAEKELVLQAWHDELPEMCSWQTRAILLQQDLCTAFLHGQSLDPYRGRVDIHVHDGNQGIPPPVFWVWKETSRWGPNLCT